MNPQEPNGFGVMAPKPPAVPAAPAMPAAPAAPAAAPAAPSVPQIKPMANGSYNRAIVNPEAFKSMIVKKYPDGVSADGTRYADMNANDLVGKMVQKYPHGMTDAGVPYVAYQDIGAAAGPSDPYAGNPIMKGVSDFLGTTGLGKGLMQAIFLNFTPEGQDLQKRVQSGEMSYEDLSNVVGGIEEPHQVVGSAAQTLADVALPSGTGSWLAEALKWAGVGALSGGGAAVESGKDALGTAEQAGITALGTSLLGPAGKLIGAVGSKITGALPEKLYSQFFKTTAEEFAKGMDSEAAKLLQKSDPELFQNFVDRGVIKVGEDGAVQVSKSTAQKAIEAGLMGSPKKMGAAVVAENMRLSSAVDAAAQKAPPIKLNGWYRNSLVQLLTTFRDRIQQSGGGMFANPLLDPLNSAIGKLTESKGELATADALQIRRMLDAMQKAKAYVTDANLTISDSVLKNATNFLRRAVNAAPGMGDLMSKWSDNMAMLTDLQKRGAQLESAKALNLFDLMAVTEGAQVFGGARDAIGKGLTFDAVMKFLTSATGGTYTGQGLYRLGQAAASPAGEKITGALGAGGKEMGLNIFKDIFNAGSTAGSSGQGQ